MKPRTVAALALGLVACAAPSRKLSVREIDRPLTLPDAVARLDLGAGIAGEVTPEPDTRLALDGRGHHFGLTDRVEMSILPLGVRVLLADETGVATSPAPRSWAIGAALLPGIALSRFHGRALASLDLKDRLDARLWLFGSAGGGARFLGGVGVLQASAFLSGGVGYQLLDPLALELTLAVAGTDQSYDIVSLGGRTQVVGDREQRLTTTAGATLRYNFERQYSLRVLGDASYAAVSDADDVLTLRALLIGTLLF